MGTPGVRRDRLAYRLILYLAVCALVVGSPRGASAASAAWIAAVYLVLGTGGVLAQALASGRRTRVLLLALAAGLDLAAQAFVVARMGGPESPFLLLLALPILVWGVLEGVAGGAAVAAGAVVADAMLLAPAGSGGAWVPVLLYQALAFLLLGLFAGLLGSRVQQAEALHRETCRELEQAQLDAESIISRLSRGILCLDRDGRISRLNAHAESLLLGLAEIGRNLADLAGDPRLAALSRHLEERLGRPGEETHEIALGPEDGVPAAIRSLEVTTTPVLDRDGRHHGLVVVLSDQTARRGRERERRRRERLAVIGELSAGLAHEIRNSLKPITGSVELLRRELKPGEDAGRDALMEIVLRESESLENFLTEFLDFARDKNLEMTVLPLETVLGEELESLNALPDSPFVLRRPCPGEVPLRVRADRGALRQVVRNLGINALQAGGGAIELGWRREGPEGVVFVRDHGPGIPEEIRSKVFDPFFTTKRDGTGLGLAIARDLVDRLGGALTLTPADGGGTLACVRLPLVGTDETRQDTDPEPLDRAA